MSSNIRHSIYLVRHGQCRGNISGETLPPEEDLITDHGKLQAAALGDHLKDVEFTIAYSSHYQRAFETAKGILDNCEKSCSSILKTDQRIKERELGEFVGTPTKEIIKVLLKKMSEGIHYNQVEIPGGESIEEYVERQRHFLRDLFEMLKAAEKGETVLIVSHGLLMRRLLVGLSDGTFSDLCTVSNWTSKCASVIHNTSCTTFLIEFSQDSPKPIITFDKIHDIEHLSKIPASPHKDEGQKSTFNVTQEEREHFIAQAMKIPNAKEQLSGCIQM